MPGGASAGNATDGAVTPFEEASAAAALGELPAHAANLLADCLLACFALLMATRLLAFRPQPLTPSPIASWWPSEWYPVPLPFCLPSALIMCGGGVGSAGRGGC